MLRESEPAVKTRYGFTLVEVLVVIAIIAILAAIVFVLMGPSREKSREVVCISNLRQIGQAVAMYRVDYESYMGNSETRPRNVLQRLGVPHSQRALIEAGYFTRAERDILICPDDARQDTWRGSGILFSHMWCPGSKDRSVPGTGLREGASWQRYREFGDGIAVALDEHHWQYYHRSKENQPENKAPNEFWYILRLNGSVTTKRAHLPPEGSCAL